MISPLPIISPCKACRYIDTHAHLTAEQVLPHIEGILERATQQGIEQIVNICTNEKSLSAGLKLRECFSGIFNTAATTPHDVVLEGEAFFPHVARCAEEGKLIAIGETGLDYHYMHSPRDVQQQFLLRYFTLALHYHLPLIFHCREAFKDLFALADEHYHNAPAILHCFTGTLEEANGVLERGWLLSFSGIITFKKSEQLREIARHVPLDRLLLETDTPFLAPQKHRGKSNEPSFLPEIAEAVAKIKGTSLANVAQQTKENAERFFSFSKMH